MGLHGVTGRGLLGWGRWLPRERKSVPLALRLSPGGDTGERPPGPRGQVSGGQAGEPPGPASRVRAACPLPARLLVGRRRSSGLSRVQWPRSSPVLTCAHLRPAAHQLQPAAHHPSSGLPAGHVPRADARAGAALHQGLEARSWGAVTSGPSSRAQATTSAVAPCHGAGAAHAVPAVTPACPTRPSFVPLHLHGEGVLSAEGSGEACPRPAGPQREARPRLVPGRPWAARPLGCGAAPAGEGGSCSWRSREAAAGAARGPRLGAGHVAGLGRHVKRSSWP